MYLPLDRKSLLLIALFLLVCGVATFKWFEPIEVSVAVVAQRDYVQSVVASGRVQNPNRIEVGSQVTGVVSNVPVFEGQVVTAGQTLIELDSAELQANVLQAQAAVEQARLKLKQTLEVQGAVSEQSFIQAKANHAVAIRALERGQSLFEKGFVGQAQLDDYVRAEKVANAQRLSAQQQYLTTRAGGAT